MNHELNQESIKKIAELSRLNLTEKELNEYQTDLQKILDAFRDLARVPLPAELEGEQRSNLILQQAQNLNEYYSRLQEDVENNSLSSQQFLAQCPEREGLFVRVPAILSSST